MKYQKIKEEELKNKVAQDWFTTYDCSRIIGNVDFNVSIYSKESELFERQSLLWAEAKTGTPDIIKSVVQLILTIGRARTFDKYLPPIFLSAFDYEKILFIPYNDIAEVFYINDFNWNVTPSNHQSKEFLLVEGKVRKSLELNSFMFDFIKDERELHKFIRLNFNKNSYGISKIRIDKNNFMVIYNKWLTEVKPTIIAKWDIVKNAGIIDGDFYLADLLSEENFTIKEKLFCLLQNDHYVLNRHIDGMGMFTQSTTFFSDNQVAHTQFWNKYHRPPLEEYWDYIVERRDLLVPQDIRERKGSFYTPQIWVELSQKYIADVLGENWQDEYVVWDCAAGTGNLLAGLTNKYNLWASTLDKQDVEVMKDRIKNGANLLESHVFQFDFLNNDFTKLPQLLQEIINNPEKRKKLIIYINPPYAEAGSKTNNKNKKGVKTTELSKKYKEELKKASNELYIQFLWQIYKNAKGCIIAEFSKLKHLTGLDSYTFRHNFLAELVNGFIVPAYTFDNVKGEFPIGFKIWKTNIEKKFSSFLFDVINEKGYIIGKKNIFDYNGLKRINDWLKSYYDKNSNIIIGVMHHGRNDFQSVRGIYINSFDNHDHTSSITIINIKIQLIYFAIHHSIKATWINDRDQFLYPNNGWMRDKEFQNDCLAFTLFHSQNRITSKDGTNHWIPFTEQEVDAREKFESNFMTDYIKGKIKYEETDTLFNFPHTDETQTHSDGVVDLNSPLLEGNLEPLGQQGATTQREENWLSFSTEATAVFDAGRDLWKYYHRQPGCNVNASLYDIREYFQGRNDNGKMNNKSDDEKYNELINILRDKLDILAQKIEPKVYEYGFLLK